MSQYQFEILFFIWDFNAPFTSTAMGAVIRFCPFRISTEWGSTFPRVLHEMEELDGIHFIIWPWWIVSCSFCGLYIEIWWEVSFFLHISFDWDGSVLSDRVLLHRKEFCTVLSCGSNSAGAIVTFLHGAAKKETFQIELVPASLRAYWACVESDMNGYE